MKIKNLILPVASLLIVLSVNPAKAEDKTTKNTVVQIKAEEYPKTNFLKIEGIESSSNQKGFEDYMSISSWSTGISTYDRTTTVQDFYTTIPKSKSSAALFRYLVSSRVIPSATLVVLDPATLNTANPKILFKFTMKNITISNFQMSGYDNANPVMLDQLSLKYDGGTYEAGDFDRNKKASPENSVNFVVPKNNLAP